MSPAAWAPEAENPPFVFFSRPLDVSQVTEGPQRIVSTRSVWLSDEVGAVRSPFRTLVEIIDALGGQEEPDAATKGALGSVLERHAQPLARLERAHRGRLSSGF